MAKTGSTEKPDKSNIGNGQKPRLKQKYFEEIVPAMMQEFSLKNKMQVPRIKKVVINMGVGEATQDGKALDAAMRDLAIIAGQKPVPTKAKKSIAGFKIRAGMSIGCRVTLRGDRMYEFLDRLLNIALPRIRDFRGLALQSFDDHGNYTLGIDEQLIFPEIEYDKVEKVRGMDITVVTSAGDRRLGHSLLSNFGFPFKEGR